MTEKELLVYIEKFLFPSQFFPKQLEILPQDSSISFHVLSKLDRNTLKTLYYYLLSEDEKCAECLRNFLSFIKNQNTPSINYLADSSLERIYTKARQVRREIHRMKGLLRFREVCGGYLYAQFKPENNIILPLALYFSNRMRAERILIHDIRRNIAAFCHRDKVYPAKLKDQVPSFTEDEKIFSKLWNEYFAKIAIKERLNIKIQKQKVPLKYRNFVIEFMGENSL